MRLTGVRDQSEMTRPFDCFSNLPLMSGAGAVNAAGNNFAAFSNKVSE